MARRALLALAVVLHLCTLVLYAASVLIAPLWGSLLLWVAWLVLLWVLVRLWRQHPALALLVPPASVGLFLAVVGAGGAWLGWVA